MFPLKNLHEETTFSFRDYIPTRILLTPFLTGQLHILPFLGKNSGKIDEPLDFRCISLFIL